MNSNILLNRPAIRGHELRKGVETFAHHVCKALKLRPVSIAWAPIATAAINPSGNMYLAAVRDDALIKRADVLRYLGFVVHELLHRKFTDFSAMPSYGEAKILAALHNAIEDAWIERRAIKQGLLGNIEALLTGLLHGMTAQALNEVQDWAAPEQFPFVLAIVARGYPGVSVPVAPGLEPIFAEAARRVDKCNSSTDTLDLARWVLAQLQALPKQQPKQQPEQQGDGQGDGQGEGQGEGEQQGEQQGDGQGEGAQGEQQGEQGQGQGQGEGEQQGQGDGQGESQGEGQGEGEQQGQGAPSPARPVVGDETARQVEPTLDAPDEAGSRGSFTSKQAIKRTGYHLADDARMVLNEISAPRLERDVRTLFENTATTLYSPGRRSGSINTGALGKFGTTERLFKQRRDIEGIDSAVVIVIDVSGSMFTSQRRRINNAILTAAVLIKVLQRGGVSVCVTTFGDESSVAVPWSTPTPKALQILTRIIDGNNTNDYAALKHAHDLLLARDEARKVCFVLTDGNGDVDSTREQVKAGEALGITTIGVGIQLEVGHIYSNHIIVRNIETLATASLAKIKVAA